MTGKLRFEVNDNQGCFIFPETWFGSLLDEFEELIDAYDADEIREGANKQVISSQADSLIKISRIWADFFPANTSNQPI